MRKFPLLCLMATIMGILAISCSDDDNWKDYTDWRNTNNEWLGQMADKLDTDGSRYYTKLVPDWDPGAYVLIHYFNDRALTADNLSPIYTSTVDVKYVGMLYDGTVFDSSFDNTSYGDSIYRVGVNGVIEGWTIALENMHVGDSCEVLIPYQQGYGANGSGIILPYSALKFGIKLVDIPAYEIR